PRDFYESVNVLDCIYLFQCYNYVILYLSVMQGFLALTTIFPYTTLFRSTDKKALIIKGKLLWFVIHRNCQFFLEVIVHPQVVIADRKSTRLNSSHVSISYAVFCLKKKSYNLYKGY